jgi:hypothetical protein
MGLEPWDYVFGCSEEVRLAWDYVFDVSAGLWMRIEVVVSIPRYISNDRGKCQGLTRLDMFGDGQVLTSRVICRHFKRKLTLFPGETKARTWFEAERLVLERTGRVSGQATETGNKPTAILRRLSASVSMGR